MPWKRMLAYVTGEVDQSLLLRIEYLVEENRVIRNQAGKCLRLSDAERFVKTIKTECLDRMILFGEKCLRYAVREHLVHYHAERNHQGIGNVIPFPDERLGETGGEVTRSERLGGLLSFYHRRAA